MFETYRRIQRQRAAGEIDGGFTLIELLIVIVVLGILAAIVVFALGNVTGKSAAAACQSDAKTVGVGVAALQAENPSLAAPAWSDGAAASTAPALTWIHDMITTSTITGLTGNPFVQTWPSSSSYKVSVSDGTTGLSITVVASPLTSTAPTAAGVATAPAGDVLVTGLGTTGAQSYTYDATKDPIEACNYAVTGKY